MSRKQATPRYPAAFLEALAYHEAGHAVMAALLGVPIEKVVIGPKCKYAGANGKVYFDTTGKEIPRFIVALVCVASEPAERLNPSFDRVATLHKTHRHLRPFGGGVKNDLADGFQQISAAYTLMCYTESSARRLFKADYRDLAALLVELKHEAVHRLARRLIRDREVVGKEVEMIVRRTGPTNGSAQGRRLTAALESLEWARADLLQAKRLLVRTPATGPPI